MDITQQTITDYYLTSYQDKLTDLQSEKIPSKEKEREAQKFAIQKAAQYFFDKYPHADKTDIWNKIYSAHVSRKCGVEISREVIDKAISADQSWKKSSGHAFEAMVRDLANAKITQSGLKIVLQKELSHLIKAGSIKNEERDREWLMSQIKTDTFDLFAIIDDYVFGCIQAKTSIRDRVTRDREPSLQAMERFYWSVVFVLDGDFLKLPKFKGMVNGSSSSFTQNGWHAMYVFSLPESAGGGRIFHLDGDMNPFITHITKAVSDWQERRQWFNPQWTA